MNDATRLVGGTLGVAVIRSVVVSAYQSRLGLPGGLPEEAVFPAKGSLGGAIVVSEVLTEMGLDPLAKALPDSATRAFLDSLLGGGLLAAGIALAGALLAAVLLPSRPRELRDAAATSPLTSASLAPLHRSRFVRVRRARLTPRVGRGDPGPGIYSAVSWAEHGGELTFIALDHTACSDRILDRQHS